MAKVIGELLNDNTARREMSENGLRRSQKFLWKTAAADTLSIFNELVEQSKYA
jgi:glycosyltransferase involved in cell wall biosynthesis